MREEFRVNYFKEFEDFDQCCLDGRDCCSLSWPHQILEATKEGTRIYVFVGSYRMLIRFMRQMSTEGLFGDGNYLVIYLSPEPVKLFPVCLVGDILYDLSWFFMTKETWRTRIQDNVIHCFNV